MAIKILGGIAIIIGAFLIFVATRPSEMSVTRETFVHAAPEAVFPHINNSKMANHWMPWQDSDPGLKMNYSGPEEGIDSTSSWDSQGKMGTGEARVIDSIQNKSVKTRLTYTKPFQMSQTAEISLTPVTNGTQVRWSVAGHNGFFFKMMGIFMDCDQMIGGEFEKGLSKLKTIVEAAK